MHITEMTDVYFMYTTPFVIYDSCIMVPNEQKQVGVKVLNEMLLNFYRILRRPIIPTWLYNK